ncbi:hypothetical protein C789_3077 [Microcystis aeruginosa FACHB-905 = DIANCHI905]|nr:hypothetical protein C789_3077 [Microcystis aeruginosa FACHB-905 = DIANCHI905]
MVSIDYLETVTTPNHHGDRPSEQGENANPTKCQNIHNCLC